MKIVDTFGLPDAIVEAIKNDQYDVGEKLPGTEGIYSPSSLNTPPQIRHLTRKHYDEIEEEAVTRVWALLGQAVHNVVELATEKSELETAEERLFGRLEVDGKWWTISGMLDNQTRHLGKLDDYKVTSVWTVIRMDRLAEWTSQLNVYRWLSQNAEKAQLKPGGELFDHRPVEAHDLTINAILRDWAFREALKSDKYPQTMVFKVNIPAWPYKEIEEFMRERIRVHQQDPVPDCTPEEQWYGGSKWVLRKVGNQRAVKTEETMTQMLTYCETKNIIATGTMLQAPFGTNEPGLDEQTGLNKGDYYVIERPGERIRCARYCSVAQFCPQAAREGTIITQKAYGRNNQMAVRDLEYFERGHSSPHNPHPDDMRIAEPEKITAAPKKAPF